MKCRREEFGEWEEHECFQCKVKFRPKYMETCPKCNWKKCPNGDCGCTVSEETRNALAKFYDIFCEPHNYSPQTKFALFTMLKTYWNKCKRCLK